MIDVKSGADDRVAPQPAIVISAGTKNFHLLMTGEEVHARGCLNKLVCGPYPTRLVKGLRAPLSHFRRMFNREVNVPTEKVAPIWASEVIQEFAFWLRRLRRNPTRSTAADRLTLRYYQTVAARVLRRSKIEKGVYHYRAGFGGASVGVAKRMGLVTLCDHSLADPRLLPSLVRGDEQVICAEFSELDTVSQEICADIEAADAILVNSDFVKETLITCGCNPEKVHVNYLGVDDAFVSLIPEARQSFSARGPLTILFAGFFSYRKGADVLARALQRMKTDSWTLLIAGAVDPRLGVELGEFMNSDNVRVLGMVSRQRLAELMVDSDVFVLPSRAEGSARVIFEAMACGCPVITTRESGSIVVDGVHGRLVARDSSDELGCALEEVINDPSRFQAIGLANRRLVLSNYHQKAYGDRLIELYEVLLK